MNLQVVRNFSSGVKASTARSKHPVLPLLSKMQGKLKDEAAIKVKKIAEAAAIASAAAAKKKATIPVVKNVQKSSNQQQLSTNVNVKKQVPMQKNNEKNLVGQKNIITPKAKQQVHTNVTPKKIKPKTVNTEVSWAVRFTNSILGKLGFGKSKTEEFLQGYDAGKSPFLASEKENIKVNNVSNFSNQKSQVKKN